MWHRSEHERRITPSTHTVKRDVPTRECGLVVPLPSALSFFKRKAEPWTSRNEWTEPLPISRTSQASWLATELIIKSRPCTTSKMTSQANPQALIEQLRLLNADPSSYFENDAQKRDFQKFVRQVGTAVEEPFETMQRLVYGVSDWRVALSQTATADPHPAATACYCANWPRSRHLRSTRKEPRWSTA
jgi:hypothetical protein